MNAPLSDQAVTALLTTTSDLPDGGFTERVLMHLPARRQKMRTSLGKRDVTLGVFAAAAATVGASAVMHSGFLTLPALTAGPSMQALALVAVVALGLWGAFSSVDA